MPESENYILIVGAGPAGSLAAIAFARCGFQVDVYEKREIPEAQGRTARNYSMVMNPRAVRAFGEFGVDISHKADFPFLGSVLHMGPVTKLSTHDAPGLFIRFNRSEVARLLIDHARRQFPAQIRFHFNRALQEINLAKRVATFSTATAAGASAIPEEVSYDLLVGADGASSCVRAALLEQVPGFNASSEPSGRMYKAYSEVPVQAGFPFKDPSTVEGIWFHNFQMQDPFTPGSFALMTAWNDKSGNCSGTLYISPTTAAKVTSREDHDKILRTCLGMPDSFREQVLEQLPSQPWNESSRWVSCSQLHGPHCILIGDAAHGVTPSIGEGCNAALEDAHVLAEVLKQCRNDLTRLPAAFNRRRLPDAQALVFLDKNAWVLRGFVGSRWDSRRLAYQSHQLLATARHRLLPFLFGPPTFGTSFVNNPTSYRNIVRSMYADGYTLLGLCVAAVALPAAVLARQWKRS